MTLNIRDLGHGVKFAPAALVPLRGPGSLVPNPANLLGLNECYRRLKALGWVCNNEVHPTARVSLFRLGGAAIHYDRAQGWQVDVAGGVLTRDGDLKEITVEAIRLDLLARCDPAPRSSKPTREEIQRGYDFALRPNHLNRKAPHRAEFRGIGHR